MALMDKAKGMVERAFTKGKKPPKPGEHLNEIGLIKARFDASRQARRHQEGEWAVCLSFMRTSGQWLRYKNSRLQDMRDEENYDSFHAANVYQSMILRASARACAQRPDVTFFPRTEREFDHEAASEAETCYSHYADRLSLYDLLRQVVTYALNPTTAYMKLYWDGDKAAEVPIEWDKETKEPTRFGFRPVGDPVVEFTPGHEVYLDPDSRNAHSSRWILQVRRLLVDDVNARYKPEVAVSSDYMEWTQYNRVRQLIQSNFIQQPAAEDGRVTVYEYYERPGSVYDSATGEAKDYPQGRTIVCTDSACLFYEESLPNGVMPFIPLGWVEDSFSPYDIGLGQTLAPLQGMLNGVFSQQATVASLQKGILVREGADGAGADLAERVKDTGSFIEIHYLRGEAPPTVTVPSLNTSALDNMIDRIVSFMADQSGVHDVSGGPTEGGTGAQSGVAIRLMQDADSQLMSLFHIRVEQFCKQVAERLLYLAIQNVREPRAWSVDTVNNTEKASIAVSSLDKLRNGGLVAVKVQPGSGTPQLPEMQDQQVLTYVEAGLVPPEVGLKAMKSPVATRLQQMAEEAMEQAQKEQAIAAVLGEQMGDMSVPQEGAMPPQGSAMPPEQPLMPPAGLPQ